MRKVDLRMIMALRQLTDLPISRCRDVVIEAGGDLSAAIQHLRLLPTCGLYASDSKITAVLSSFGLTYTPPAEREPIMLPDSEVLAELTADGCAVTDLFLIDGMVCSVNIRGELMACVIEDDDMAASTTAYLRRMSVPEYPSIKAYEERNRTHPGDNPRSA